MQIIFIIYILYKYQTVLETLVAYRLSAVSRYRLVASLPRRPRRPHATAPGPRGPAARLPVFQSP